ncbi:MAG: site-specific DNA-methyltransferase [Elusimicrobia bacterium]|nr:site-specific DNA-methyltransferase [Elusimicrobiota bacterium]
MPKSGYKKLELTWFNKDKILIWNEKENNYEWIEPNDIRFAEPRILKQKASYGDPNSEYNSETKCWEKSKNKILKEEQNLLIKGDNLLALKSLEDQFTGKIKLIYIDPPFNTGNAFEHYDDGLEHSIWLSLMRDRLMILKKLLSENGIILVHIDQYEHAYLKILMDDTFGRNNFINEIIWKKTNSPKAQSIGLGNQHDIVYVYGKTKEKIKIKPIFSSIDENYKKGFSYDDKDRRGVYQTVALIAGGMQRSPNRKVFEFRGVKAPWLYSAKNLEQFWKEGRIYKTKTGKYRLKKYLSEIKGRQVADIWVDSCVSPMQGSSKEYRKFLTQKPESLIKRIIEMTTLPNDWVLDSFAGSGTTGAVAHKMGRKWIMIEMGKHAETHIIPRMKRVVSGKDSTGITKDVGFNGGGGFRYCVLGKSAIKKDEMGIVEMSVDNGELIEAICKIEGFKLIEQDLFRSSKLHGVINGKRYCHIAENFVTQDYIDDLANEISEDESLVIYAMKNTSGLKLPLNIEVKKMPRDIVKKFKLPSPK